MRLSQTYKTILIFAILGQTLSKTAMLVPKEDLTMTFKAKYRKEFTNIVVISVQLLIGGMIGYCAFKARIGVVNDQVEIKKLNSELELIKKGGKEFLVASMNDKKHRKLKFCNF